MHGKTKSWVEQKGLDKMKISVNNIIFYKDEQVPKSSLAEESQIKKVLNDLKQYIIYKNRNLLMNTSNHAQQPSNAKQSQTNMNDCTDFNPTNQIRQLDSHLSMNPVLERVQLHSNNNSQIANQEKLENTFVKQIEQINKGPEVVGTQLPQITKQKSCQQETNQSQKFKKIDLQISLKSSNVGVSIEGLTDLLNKSFKKQQHQQQPPQQPSQLPQIQDNKFSKFKDSAMQESNHHYANQYNNETRSNLQQENQKATQCMLDNAQEYTAIQKYNDMHLSQRPIMIMENHSYVNTQQSKNNQVLEQQHQFGSPNLASSRRNIDINKSKEQPQGKSNQQIISPKSHFLDYQNYAYDKFKKFLITPSKSDNNLNKQYSLSQKPQIPVHYNKMNVLRTEREKERQVRNNQVKQWLGKKSLFSDNILVVQNGDKEFYYKNQQNQQQQQLLTKKQQSYSPQHLHSEYQSNSNYPEKSANSSIFNMNQNNNNNHEEQKQPHYNGNNGNSDGQNINIQRFNRRYRPKVKSLNISKIGLANSDYQSEIAQLQQLQNILQNKQSLVTQIDTNQQTREDQIDRSCDVCSLDKYINCNSNRNINSPDNQLPLPQQQPQNQQSQSGGFGGTGGEGEGGMGEEEDSVEKEEAFQQYYLQQQSLLDSQRVKQNYIFNISKIKQRKVQNQRTSQNDVNNGSHLKGWDTDNNKTEDEIIQNIEK